MKIQFSVIIPLYNKAETIGRAIRSVLNQKYSDFELIVVDDGSTDHGADIVRGFHDPRIRLIQQENGGVSKARNTGIEAAKYDYLTFLDADDEYLSKFLIEIEHLLKKFPRATFWGTAYYIRRESEFICSSTNNNTETEITDYFKISSKTSPLICSSSVCIRKETLNLIGRFPEGICSGEDLITWARVASKGNLGFSDTPLAIYNQDIFNIQKIKRQPDLSDYVGENLAQLVSIYKKKDSLKQYISYYYRGRAVHAMECGLNKMARISLYRSIIYNKWNWKSYLHLLLSFLPRKLAVNIIFISKNTILKKKNGE